MKTLLAFCFLFAGVWQAAAQDSMSVAIFSRLPFYDYDFGTNYGVERGVSVSFPVRNKLTLGAALSKFKFEDENIAPWNGPHNRYLERNHFYAAGNLIYRYVARKGFSATVSAGPTLLRYNDKIESGTYFVDVFGYTFNYDIISGTKLGYIVSGDFGVDLAPYLRGSFELSFRNFDKVERTAIFGLSMAVKIPTVHSTAVR